MGDINRRPHGTREAELQRLSRRHNTTRSSETLTAAICKKCRAALESDDHYCRTCGAPAPTAMIAEPKVKPIQVTIPPSLYGTPINADTVNADTVAALRPFVRAVAHSPEPNVTQVAPPDTNVTPDGNNDVSEDSVVDEMAAAFERSSLGRSLRDYWLGWALLTATSIIAIIAIAFVINTNQVREAEKAQLAQQQLNAKAEAEREQNAQAQYAAQQQAAYVQQQQAASFVQSRNALVSAANEEAGRSRGYLALTLMGMTPSLRIQQWDTFSDDEKAQVTSRIVWHCTRCGATVEGFDIDPPRIDRGGGCGGSWTQAHDWSDR